MLLRGLGPVVPIAKDTIRAYGEDKISKEAAALAYFALFALAPLLIVIIEIVALLLGSQGEHNAARDQVLAGLRPSIGRRQAAVIGSLVQATLNQSQKAGIPAGVLSWIILMGAATGLFVSLQNVLDDIWGVHLGKRSLLATLRDRVVAFALIVGAVVVLLISLCANTAIAIVTSMQGSLLGSPIVIQVVDLVVSTVILTAVFAAIFKVLPHVTLGWKDVLLGGFITAILFAVGQIALSWYLGRAGTGSAFGAAGSIVILLLWIYYSGQILLIGAEVTKAYTRGFGSHRS